jgi:hypothetical protein
MDTVLDYKTHILVGVRASGTMEILYHWLSVPTQAEVQERIDAARSGFKAYALCAPTSILAPEEPARRSEQSGINAPG